MNIFELKYSSTNTYLIESDDCRILFDTGWAGTFPLFCRELGKLKISVQSIDYIIISHFHPDHMGIAQEIAENGPVIIAADVQKSYIHSSDEIFVKEKKNRFIPVKENKVITVSISDSRRFLDGIGIKGELLHTPGHSEDSISLFLDGGELFVGDLNPLYELELHKGTQIAESWDRLLALKPKRIYYGHAKTAEFGEKVSAASDSSDLFNLVSRIMKYIDKGYPLESIQKKTKADAVFIEDVTRMYLTHKNVGVQGILDRIEIKWR